jgi:hypothetical protein
MGDFGLSADPIGADVQRGLHHRHQQTWTRRFPAFPLGWARYLLSSRDQGPLAPVLATRICISLMLEFVCLAMVLESLPLDRLPPSRAGQRGHLPIGCSPVRRPPPTLRCDLDGVGRTRERRRRGCGEFDDCDPLPLLLERLVSARARVIYRASRGSRFYLSVAHGGGCRLRYPLPQTPANVSYAHAPHHP